MLKIKSLTLKNPVIQAPLAGYTDLAFRLLCREHGMGLAFIEMVAAEGLIRQNKKTFEIMETCEADRPLGGQLVGNRPAAMAEAARLIERMGFDVLDINMGCPVPKIAGKGAGCALMAKPKEAEAVIRAVVEAVRIPVTVKMRLGLKDASGKEACALARIAEDAGVSAVSVHGRTQAQGYSGKADYDAIRRVKESVRIPVIGNGDVFSAEDALRLAEVSKADGLMIGRGSLGHPWIFEEIRLALERKTPKTAPSIEDKKKALLRHLELELRHKAEKLAILYMRHLAPWYFKNLPGSKEFRIAVNACTQAKRLQKIIKEF